MPYSPPVHSIKQSEQSRLQGQKEYNRTKRENQSFYSSSQWTKASKQYRKANPLCVMCNGKGITTPAQCVDHIKPIKYGGDPFSHDNLRSLCNMHHAQVTVEQNEKYNK